MLIIFHIQFLYLPDGLTFEVPAELTINFPSYQHWLTLQALIHTPSVVQIPLLQPNHSFLYIYVHFCHIISILYIYI